MPRTSLSLSGLSVIAGLGLFIAPAALAGQALDFLAGHWCQHSDNGVIEETWFPPAGGETVGMNRMLKGKKMVAFESMRITRVDGLATFTAQPGGRPPVEFSRTDGGEDWVRFENPEHDFPTSIEYRLTGKALKATISGPGENGTESSIPFIFKPCKDTQDL